mgnify:CR=1
VEFRKRNVWEYEREVEHMSTVYKYEKMEFLNKEQLRARLGS